jgi:hypothetical protein
LRTADGYIFIPSRNRDSLVVSAVIGLVIGGWPEVAAEAMKKKGD